MVYTAQYASSVLSSKDANLSICVYISIYTCIYTYKQICMYVLYIYCINKYILYILYICICILYVCILLVLTKTIIGPCTLFHELIP